MAKPDGDPNRLDWIAVRLAFYQLREWYEENDTYHLIGYIIDRRIKTIRELFKASEDCGKTKFKKLIVQFISNFFAGAKIKNNNDSEDDRFLACLRYSEHNDWIEHTLLLYNLELYKTSHAQYRFPFDRFKNQKWSLEHIHAQNSEELVTIGEVRDWLQDTEEVRKTFQSVEQDLELEHFPEESYATLKQLLYQKGVLKTDSISDCIRSLIFEISEKLADCFDMHTISNMALLDGATNSAFGKQRFSKKRKKLIEIDRQPWHSSCEKEKVFIPIGTKNVFLKHSSHSIDQLSVWGAQDRADYHAHIEVVLKYFLPEEGTSYGSLDALVKESLEQYSSLDGGHNE